MNAAAYQLNGTTPLDGTFVYSPAAGTILMVGTKQLSVTFTPNDTANYTSATKVVPITVSQATLTISANSYTRLYGVANPVFQGSITGAENGDVFTETFANICEPSPLTRVSTQLSRPRPEPTSPTTSRWYRTER